MTTPETTPRPGDQLASTACGTRVVVIRAPADARPQLTCAGAPMAPATSVPQMKDPGSGTVIGKRYVDATGTLELLCTASGTGELACDGAPMAIKAAKPLPASD
ncbi:hypothetical protein ACKI1I_24285 [Streptomyces turgidiscabies]|uniref:Uncharacterized protein n=1 Tax=Streptomyces turgidiscabies (strain Car8) TaxID=698760 RepID=L7FFM2_STRT8|nr:MULTISPECIES: hypothetical protein [Streptomyces]ELP69891.1 hypothetical protein STRTUCAR8_00386 [Streptomyces turgidiscabies Car8]MDX3499077.1 hypothetical protein [Streptomyces turgidiscabies]GAQ73526.1 hypothetical protein T45_05284 [Streptomyces turgidiscabies]